MKVRVGKRNLTVIRRKLTTIFGATFRSSPRQGTILVDETLRGLPALSTLLHEMIHQLDWRLSEKRVQQLEYSLVALILSNPAVFKAVAAEAPLPPRRSRRPRRKS